MKYINTAAAYIYCEVNDVNENKIWEQDMREDNEHEV